MNFGSGTSASFGTGVTVEQASTLSATQLASTVVIAADATLGARDVTVANPCGESATLPGAFVVTPAPPSLSLSYEGKLRDRVGKGTGLTTPDGALDGTFKVTVEPGSGPRTVTQLELGHGRQPLGRRPRHLTGWSVLPEGLTAPSTRQQRQRQLRHR